MGSLVLLVITAAAAATKCVDDPAASGAYAGPATDTHYAMRSPNACVYARMGHNASHCALRRQRVAFVGDSTMRQLFGAVACKLDGRKANMPGRRLAGKGGGKASPKRPAARKPRGLPGRSDDGKYALTWVTYKMFPGANECEPEVTEPKAGARPASSPPREKKKKKNRQG